jgi:hypothetical protein
MSLPNNQRRHCLLSPELTMQPPEIRCQKTPDKKARMKVKWRDEEAHN